MAKKLFNVSVDVNGETYNSKGETMGEAISMLELDYTKIKTKGVISASYGEKKSSKLFYLRPLRRIFANKLRKLQVAKDLEYLLK